MIMIASKEAKNRFGEVLDQAQHEPVAISKKGRPVAVVLSKREYERLEELEDTVLAMQADAAFKSAEWVGVEQSMQALRNLVDAKA